MLVDGPSEWAEASIPVGNKLDLLQHAYNGRIGVAALPKDATVVLVRYIGSATGSAVPSDEVMDVAREEVVLHSASAPIDKNTKADVFRYISWSKATKPRKQEHFVAVATMARVEIWRVDAKDSVHAVMVGVHHSKRVRGICWNPVKDILLVYSDIDLELVEITSDSRIQVHAVSLDATVGSLAKAKQCLWDPTGLSLARSTDHTADFLTWSASDELTTSPPAVSSYNLDASPPTSLLAQDSKVGSVTAMALLSPSLCVLATDVPLVLDDIKPMKSLHSVETSTASAFLSTATPSSGANVIDLTGLRITAAPKSSLLNILNQPTPMMPTTTPSIRRTSHVTIISKTASGQWQRCSQIQLGQLTTPDVLDVEAMRVVVGSTISNRLVALHLDHSPSSGWTASISGELELPEGHVCRGLRLTQTSPFVQVASTEKAKRTFFHASSGPQRIQLSKFKMPRRRRTAPEVLLQPGRDSIKTDTTEQATTTVSNQDGLAAVLSQLGKLQTLMVARFDHLEQRLDAVCGRLDRLEVYRGDQHSVKE